MKNAFVGKPTTGELNAILDKDIAMMEKAKEVKNKIVKEYTPGSRVLTVNPKTRFEKSSVAKFGSTKHPVTGVHEYRVEVADGDKKVSKLYHELKKVSTSSALAAPKVEPSRRKRRKK